MSETDPTPEALPFPGTPAEKPAAPPDICPTCGATLGPVGARPPHMCAIQPAVLEALIANAAASFVLFEMIEEQNRPGRIIKPGEKRVLPLADLQQTVVRLGQLGFYKMAGPGPKADQ